MLASSIRLLAFPAHYFGQHSGNSCSQRRQDQHETEHGGNKLRFAAPKTESLTILIQSHISKSALRHIFYGIYASATMPKRATSRQRKRGVKPGRKSFRSQEENVSLLTGLIHKNILSIRLPLSEKGVNQHSVLQLLKHDGDRHLFQSPTR